MSLPGNILWLLMAIMALALCVPMGYLLSSYFKDGKKKKKDKKKVKKKKDKKKKPEALVNGAATEEFIDTLLMTYDNIENTSDTRKAIMLCYSRLCKALAKVGVVREPELTPREFYAVTTASFKKQSKSMQKLTIIFEEAVYSEHDMGEIHRKHALRQLKKTVTEVRSWSSPPSSAASSPTQ